MPNVPDQSAAHASLERRRLRFRPLRERTDRVFIERDHVRPEAEPNTLSDSAGRIAGETAERLRAARDRGASRMLAFGAHAIKNGLSPVMIRLIETGWVTHLATNGAGIIHDWEFAYQGTSSEHVAENVARGEFGAWEETGFFLNAALLLGAYRGLGYGASIGSMVEEERLIWPDPDALLADARSLGTSQDRERAAAAVDLLDRMERLGINPGEQAIPHPYKAFGLQAAAYRLGVPFTGHPMFGHDIIYLHPMNHGAAIGRTAERDFLSFAHAVTQLSGGVYISIGSAVMSPMVFEKSMSMAQNLARQDGRRIDGHFLTVVDLQASHWDWSKGEPPEDNPDYYLRYNKSFSRMGGTLRYACADNRDFLLSLCRALNAV